MYNIENKKITKSKNCKMRQIQSPLYRSQREHFSNSRELLVGLELLTRLVDLQNEMQVNIYTYKKKKQEIKNGKKDKKFIFIKS